MKIISDGSDVRSGMHTDSYLKIQISQWLHYKNLSKSWHRQMTVLVFHFISKLVFLHSYFPQMSAVKSVLLMVNPFQIYECRFSSGIAQINFNPVLSLEKNNW